MFGTCGVIMIYAWNWKSVIRVLQEIHQIDLKFQLMKHPVDFTTHRQHILLGSGLSLFLHQSILLFYNINTTKHIEDQTVSWQMILGQIYFNIVYFSIVCLFFCMSYIMSFRFVHLNQTLKLRFDTSNGDRQGFLLGENSHRGGSLQERIRAVQKIANIYHQLTEITFQLNGQFADVLALNIVVMLMFSVFNIFALLKVYASDDSRTLMFSVFNLCGGLFYSLMFLPIVGLSQMVSKESKLTGVLLHKAMNNESNGALIRSMMLFSRQIRNRSAIIASRNIVIDWPFIFQTIAVLVSYLVILLQFDAAIR
ncbi:gustatory and pheromone receptor 33a-like [Anopheles merus]|uniref:gustatory and pheromone receptor 33a-like n=1 Tax=Anopheles merus TaxID=30066 RepID=UPI001BE4CD70|nr:gustatory and pheromone receptor 33a-like [Anopheles merus]